MKSLWGVSFVALSLVACQAHAGEVPLYAAQSEWVKPAPPVSLEDAGANAPLFLILDQQRRVEDGRVWSYFDQALRIQSPEMLAKLGTLVLEWQPDQGDLVIHRVEILRGTETIDLLAKGDKFTVLRRETQLEKMAISGTLTATMAAEGLRVGDILRLTYSTSSRDATLKGNVQTAVPLIADPIRASFGRVRVTWPAGLDLRWRSYAGDAKPQEVATEKGFKAIELALPLAKAPDLPTDIPVRFKPLSLLEATSFKSWGDVAAVMAPLYAPEGKIAKGGALAGEVAKIADGTQDPRERAAAALRLVQDQVRYLFNGMNGGNYVPQAPERTWEVRYGDCKAKTLLLLSMLHELGIEAEPVLANSQLGDGLADRLPSAGAFDHVLVRATIDGQSYWLDGTGSGTRLADLGDTPAFGHVLPVRAAGATLMPLVTQPHARPDMTVELSFDDSAGLHFARPFEATIQFRGALGGMINANLSQAPKEQLNKAVDEMVGKYLDNRYIVERSMTWDADQAIVTLHASGIAPSNWRHDRDHYRLPIDWTVSALDFDPNRSKAAWQPLPVITNPPEKVVFRVRVHLPDGGKGYSTKGADTLPAELAGTAMTRSVAIKDGWLTLEDVSRTDGREITPEALPAQRAAVAAAKAREIEVLSPTDYPTDWQLLSGLDRKKAFATALARFQAGIDEDPKLARGYSERASFLSDIYDYRGAIADMDRVVEGEPTVANYVWRAQLWRKLEQPEKALADVKAALKLDPGNRDAVYQFAWAAMDTGKIDDAIALVDERIAQGGDKVSEMLALKSDLLSRQSHPEAALAAMEEALHAKPTDAWLLNQRCWLKARLKVELPSALKDCTKSIELSESPASALDSRALVYFQMNRLDDALGDLAAALELSPSFTDSLYLRGLIRQKQGDAGGQADLLAARMMAPEIDQQYVPFGIRAE